MALTSTRFVGPIAVPNTYTAILTVPAGHRYLIRNLTVNCTSTTAATLIALAIGGSTGPDRLWQSTVAIGASAILDPWWVLNAGDVLQATRAGTGAGSLVVCGYDLIV